MSTPANAWFFPQRFILVIEMMRSFQRRKVCCGEPERIEGEAFGL
jgi:hypothetical protein